MSLSAISAKCDKCGSQIQEIPKRTLFGFRKIICQKCQTVNHYPMTGGYRIAFWVMFVWMIFYTVRQIDRLGIGYIIKTSDGPLFVQALAELAIPVLIVSGLAYGIFKDSALRKKIRITEHFDK